MKKVYLDDTRSVPENFEGQRFASHWESLMNSSKAIFEKKYTDLQRRSYWWNKVGYILYKYEAEQNDEFRTIRKEIFKGDSVSIDHIVAQSLSLENLGFTDYPAHKGEADKLWEEILTVINGIGNLSLSTASSNSSDSNGKPTEHIETYRNLGLKKTAEIVSSWEEPKGLVDKINERSKLIIDFIADKVINNDSMWK